MNMLVKKINEKGFTLLELLLYIATSAVMLGTIVILLSSLLSARVKNQNIAEIDQQGMQIMQTILQSVRNASAVTSPVAQTASSSLTLAFASSTINPTVFDLSSGIVGIKEGLGSVIPLNNGRVVASNLLFSNLSLVNTPGSIKIQFTLSAASTSSSSEFIYQKTFVSSASLR